MRRLRFRIEPMYGECQDYVENVIRENPEYYGEYDEKTAMHLHFYQVWNKDTFAGFFGLARWEFEVTVCCVYVEPQYRKKGVFNAMIKWVKRHTPRGLWITINAMKDNARANEIYRHKFKYEKYDEVEKIEWYVIRARKQKKEEA